MATQKISGYRILRELGRGGTASVFLARDPASGRQVALKILAAPFTTHPEFPERFEQTLKALVALAHPYLVPVYDYGGESGQYFIVMRYMPGGTLADRLDGRPMLLAEVVPILQRLAEALDAAHTAGLVHGDLNPAHVLFDIQGRAFLADLGLAPLLHHVGAADEGQPALPGVPAPLAGGWARFVTPAYMSPEQAAGEGEIDGRSDVYALGVMLFEMLTGLQPFQAAAPDEVIRLHQEAPPPQLSEGALARLVLPAEFNLMLARAFAKRREARYPTAGVLVEAVRSTFLTAAAPAETEPVTGPPLAPPEEPPPEERPAPLSRPPGVVPLGEPVEIVRAEPLDVPAGRPRAFLFGVGGIGLAVIAVLIGLARVTNFGGWGLPPTSTATFTLAATLAPAATATTTATETATPTSTATASRTPTASPSLAPTTTSTSTATDTATATRTATRRPTLPPAPTATPEITLLPADATASASAPPPSPTNTFVPRPTRTATPRPTRTPTSTATRTATATRTPTATATSTP